MPASPWLDVGGLNPMTANCAAVSNPPWINLRRETCFTELSSISPFTPDCSVDAILGPVV